jgi:hypothetical protein
VSLAYCRRLARGIISGVPDTVLEPLASALQLDDAERGRLFDSARAANPKVPQPRRLVG